MTTSAANSRPRLAAALEDAGPDGRAKTAGTERPSPLRKERRRSEPLDDIFSLPSSSEFINFGSRDVKSSRTKINPRPDDVKEDRTTRGRPLRPSGASRSWLFFTREKDADPDRPEIV